MRNQSGREIKVAISPSDTIDVRGKDINIYRVIKKCGFIPKISVRQGRSSVLLISGEILEAIRTYAGCDGYADLKLLEFLEKMFGEIK